MPFTNLTLLIIHFVYSPPPFSSPKKNCISVTLNSLETAVIPIGRNWKGASKVYYGNCENVEYSNSRKGSGTTLLVLNFTFFAIAKKTRN